MAKEDERRQQLGNSTNKHDNSNRNSDEEDSDAAASKRRNGDSDSDDGGNAKGRRPRAAVGKTDRNNLNLINVRDGEPLPKNSSRATGK